MIYNRIKALTILKPNKQWSWGGTDYSGLTWHESDTAPTESEIDAEVTRLNNAEPMRLLREERDRLLTACDWRASSDLTLADDWKTYRQALRDLPTTSSSPTYNLETGVLGNVNWPTPPS